MVIGLTVVAFGTSSPEILVSVQAALAGAGAIAVGNVVGSNLFNVGVILGLTAVIAPMKVNFQLLKIDAPLMVFASLLVPLVLADGRISRFDGAALFVLICIYVAANVVMARRTADAEIEREFADSLPPPGGSLAREILYILAGLVLLALGARLLTDNAVAMARIFKVSEAVIGLTIVAAGTSVPELAASIVAALRKEPDIAMGNVIGSNIFNVLAILGISAMVAPLEAPGIRAFDLYAMIALSVALLPLLWTSQRLQRVEGAFLFACYFAYILLLWPKG